MASLAPPSSSKFKLFARARARSPAHRKREPPAVLTLGPLSPQARWEAESDGDAQEFRAQEAAASEKGTPQPGVRTAPLTVARAPSPLYPQHPYTAGPSHHAQFLAPSPPFHLPQELQHPVSAHYERLSQESERDEAKKDLHRSRGTNARRPESSPRDGRDFQTWSPKTRGRSPDPRRRGFYAGPASTTPSSRVTSPQNDIDSFAAEGEVDLDIYPWFIFQRGKSEDLTKGAGDSVEYSFMSLQ